MTRTEAAAMAERQLMTLQQVDEIEQVNNIDQFNTFWTYCDLIDATMAAVGAGNAPGAGGEDLETAAEILADLASNIQSGPPGAMPVKQVPVATCMWNRCRAQPVLSDVISACQLRRQH